jgi:Alpha/beta hydrolase domain
VAQAAIEHLESWARGGAAPPVAPRLAVDAELSGFQLDERGNVLGGIRTPWVDVPVAVLSGLGQVGEVFVVLFGQTLPYDEATLASLYPGGVAEYLERFGASLDATIESGFLLAEDRAEILEVAASSFPLVVT